MGVRSAGVHWGLFAGALKETGSRDQGTGNREPVLLSSSSLQFAHKGNEHATDFVRKLLCPLARRLRAEIQLRGNDELRLNLEV